MSKALKMNDEDVKIAHPLKVVTRDQVVHKVLEKLGKITFAFQSFSAGLPQRKGRPNRLLRAYKNKAYNVVIEFGPNQYGERESLLARYFTCTLTHDLSTKVNIDWYFEQMANAYYILANEGIIYPTIMGSIGMLELSNVDTGSGRLFDNSGKVYAGLDGMATISNATKYVDSNATCCPLPIPNDSVTRAVADLNNKKSDIISTDNVLVTKVFFMFVFAYQVRGKGFATASELNKMVPLPGFAEEGRMSGFSDWNLIYKLTYPEPITAEEIDRL